MEELFTLRKKVARFEKVKEKLERLKARVYALYEDANYAEPFVPPEPNEDELVRHVYSSLHSQANDSDMELLGVQYHSPPPASLDMQGWSILTTSL